MALFENFPYSNEHQLNLDWIIKIAKDFLEQYTHIQQLIADGETSLQNITTEGLQQLQTKADDLESLLNQWYNTHSQDIANQLAQALADLAAESQTVFNAFEEDVEEKASQTIASIPADYTQLSNTVAFVKNAMSGGNVLPVTSSNWGFVQTSDGSIYQGGTTYKYTEVYPVDAGDKFFYKLYGSASVLVIAAYETENANAVINKSVAGVGSSTELKGIYTVPDGIHYVRISYSFGTPSAFYYMKNEKFAQTITEGDFNTFEPSSNPYIIITGTNFQNAPARTTGTLWCFEDWLYGIRYQIFIRNADAAVFTRNRVSGTWSPWTSTQDAIEKETLKIDGQNLIDINTMSYGFVQASNGQLYQGGETYKYSGFIPVYPGEKYAVYGYASASVLKIAAYENDYSDAVINKSMLGDSNNNNPVTNIYTVPEGIKYIRVSMTKYYNGKVTLISSSKLNKEISILFVGNSLTQDGIAYLPYLLHEFYPDIMFRFYIWYNGGYTLADQYAKFLEGTACDIFSAAENTGVWYNIENQKSITDVLQNYTFDIVCMQEYFNYKSEYTQEDLNTWNNCQHFIQNNYTGGNPLEFITMFHAPKRDNATAIFNLEKTGIATILRETIAQDMIPNGLPIYRAMSTALDNIGDAGHLSADGTHAQEGLPCLLQAWSNLLWIFDKFGINKSIYGDSFRMTQAIAGSIQIPGGNFGTGTITGTDAQNILAQDVAIKGYKEAKQFTMFNLSNNN